MTLEIGTHNINYYNHYHTTHKLEMVRNKVKVAFQSCRIINVLLQGPPPLFNMISFNSLV
jgi:hypothetical protein